MPEHVPRTPRIVVDGKFFRAGAEKFFIKGVTYGPFVPNEKGEHFHDRQRTGGDFALIREMGGTLLRVYHLPPAWFLDLALEHNLRVLIDIPWAKHICFLDSKEDQEAARVAVRGAVAGCGRHPAVFAFSVVNELSPDVVRWSGMEEVAEFIENLVDIGREEDPDCLFTFANYPPTEFLAVKNIDFYCFNVYLHHQKPYENYLARLQMLADSKPLVIGEFGIDSYGEGEDAKCEILSWHIETTFRAGAAGAIIYSFSDEWFTGGHLVEKWAFGLTDARRIPKPSYFAVQKKFAAAPYFPLPAYPLVSVVVASYNGARTLRACLDSLQHLRYPHYEVILVDDGSTDGTPQIAANYSRLLYLSQPNMGLSVARNAGIFAASGEIIAFTDSDCRADEDWLHYLIGDLLKGKLAAIGGHNFLPPDDSYVATAVQASPGAPAHVMLTDRIAEHIPGCNMAFYAWALKEVGWFDPMFRKAGDDVDICWRIQQRGYKIGFSPGGFVWHYRRSTVNAYLRQQSGYGEAESMLVRRHPEYFNAFGGSIWHGRIYSASKYGVTLRKPIIYHGLFASGFFQTLYSGNPAMPLMFCTSLEYYVLITLPLLVLSVPFHDFLPLALVSIVFSLFTCVVAAAQAELPRKKRKWWSKSLVAALYFLQPVCRGWARYQGRLSTPPTPQLALKSLSPKARKLQPNEIDLVAYWGSKGVSRFEFISKTLERLDAQGWQLKTDEGWSEYDFEVYGSRWAHLQVTSVSEPHPENEMLRCRLQSGWSLPAKITFWSSLALELLFIGVLKDWTYWIWFALLPSAFIAFWLDWECASLQRLIVSVLDEVAESMGIKKVEPKTLA